MSGLWLNEIEGLFLTYLAQRINYEISRWQRHEQDMTVCRAHIDRLSDRALEILRSKDELQAWLEAATQEPSLRDAFPTGRSARVGRR